MSKADVTGIAGRAERARHGWPPRSDVVFVGWRLRRETMSPLGVAGLGLV